MPLTARFNEALVYAAELHAAQTRKVSAVPYIAHLLGVASLVLEYGGSEDCAIAALLHDAIEDQGGLSTRDEIGRRFGDQVVAIVEGCTDANTMPKPPWRERKEAHLTRLRAASPDVWLVVAADKLHNARSLMRELRSSGPRVWQSFRGGAEGTVWYYEATAELARGAALPPGLFDELRSVVNELALCARTTV